MNGGQPLAFRSLLREEGDEQFALRVGEHEHVAALARGPYLPIAATPKVLEQPGSGFGS